MIELPRSLARDFRAVLRRALAEQAPRGPLPAVLCRAGPDGLALHAAQDEVAVRYHRAGDHPPAALGFPAAALATFEGAGAGLAVLEETGVGRGRARWQEAGAARAAEFPTVPPDRVPSFPEEPAAPTPVAAGFLAALGEAARTTAERGGRLALARVQLRGGRGEVVATDGRQLLVQGGFPLPWEGDVLVPAVPAFAGRLLAAATPVAVGRTETHVFVHAGPWTFALAADAGARYPEVRDVIPRHAGRGATRLRLDAADAALLLRALPRLPGGEDDLAPVTLELGPRPAVRAHDEAGRAEEVVLARSHVEGPPRRLVSNRRYLARALRLGFTVIEAGPGEQPLVCRDGPRTYLWMTLSADAAVPPTSPDRRSAPGGAPEATPDPSPADPDPLRRPDMPPPVPPGGPARNGAAATSPEAGLDALLAEAEALRGLLHEGQARLARLAAGLRLYRRQAKAVEAALASLRPFQRTAP